MCVWGEGGGGGSYVSICMPDTVLSDVFHFSTNEEIYNRTLLVMLFILFPENDNPRFFPLSFDLISLNAIDIII